MSDERWADGLLESTFYHLKICCESRHLTSQQKYLPGSAFGDADLDIKLTRGGPTGVPSHESVFALDIEHERVLIVLGIGLYLESDSLIQKTPMENDLATSECQRRRPTTAPKRSKKSLPDHETKVTTIIGGLLQRVFVLVMEIKHAAVYVETFRANGVLRLATRSLADREP